MEGGGQWSPPKKTSQCLSYTEEFGGCMDHPRHRGETVPDLHFQVHGGRAAVSVKATRAAACSECGLCSRHCQGLGCGVGPTKAQAVPRERSQHSREGEAGPCLQRARSCSELKQRSTRL